MDASKVIVAEIGKIGVAMGESAILAPMVAGWIAAKGVQGAGIGIELSGRLLADAGRAGADALASGICAVDDKSIKLQSRLDEWAGGWVLHKFHGRV